MSYEEETMNGKLNLQILTGESFASLNPLPVSASSGHLDGFLSYLYIKDGAIKYISEHLATHCPTP